MLGRCLRFTGPFLLRVASAAALAGSTRDFRPATMPLETASRDMLNEFVAPMGPNPTTGCFFGADTDCGRRAETLMANCSAKRFLSWPAQVYDTILSIFIYRQTCRPTSSRSRYQRLLSGWRDPEYHWHATWDYPAALGHTASITASPSIIRFLDKASALEDCLQ